MTTKPHRLALTLTLLALSLVLLALGTTLPTCPSSPHTRCTVQTPRWGVSTTLILAQGADLVGIRLPAAKTLVAALSGAANALMVVSGPLVVPLGVGWEDAVGQLAFSVTV